MSFQRILTPNLNRLSRTGFGWDRDQTSKKARMFQVPVRASQPPAGRGPSWGSRSRDDEWLFAMCMFCIFSRFAALAAGAAGKKACPAVCSPSPDSDK